MAKACEFCAIYTNYCFFPALKSMKVVRVPLTSFFQYVVLSKVLLKLQLVPIFDLLVTNDKI